jgi:Ca2+-transporting ATPase
MAMGVRRMVRRNALVRRLSAIETLSAATVICTDKTGTLTRNEMTVHSLWIPRETIRLTGIGYAPEGEVKMPASPAAVRQVKLLLTAAVLCNNAVLQPPKAGTRWKLLGDSTEGALLAAAIKGGLNPDEIRRLSPRASEVPFDTHRRIMTVIVRWNLPELWSAKSSYLVFTKGDPQEVLKRCVLLLENGQARELTGEDRKTLMSTYDGFASDGYRMLGIAFREWDGGLQNPDAGEVEEGLTFIGLTAMMDPARPEAGEALRRCKEAGIAVTMVTGDYGPTAKAVARRVGLASADTPVITGDEIEAMSRGELEKLLSAGSEIVFARVNPEQKLNLVQAYKSLGHVVAVTGDGANDAPALRAANIGIAMGVSGTDVARGAADIVLLDDNFSTIVAAVEQGRTIYANIRKFMTYILTSNVPEIVPFIAMVVLGIPPGLTILQILAIDLGTDILPALALGSEPSEPGIMVQPPRRKNKPILDISLLMRSYGFLGIIEALGGMLAFFSVWWRHGYSLAEMRLVTPALVSGSADAATVAVYHEATTMTLAAIVIAQIGNVFACRSESASIFRHGYSGSLIWTGIAVELALIMAIVYLPPLQEVFRTAALSWTQWAALLVIPLALVLAEEARKSLVRRRMKPS